MRRIGIVLLVMVMGLVIASPATAKKPDKPKPPSAVPIAVSLSAEPVWVHEDADVIRYTVTLENKTSDAIGFTSDDRVTLEFTAANATKTLADIEIPANGSVTADFSRTVSLFSEATSCGDGDECPLPASAKVFINGDLLTQATMSTPLMPYPSCGFDYVLDGEENLVSNSVEVSDRCIWTLRGTDDALPGVWGVTLAPTPPKKGNRAITAVVTVRDGVPGNWCPLAVDADWGFGARWTSGDPDITGEVYLPADGVCLAGGANGEFYEVGNPSSFYLSANGDVTVQWLGENPGDWDSSWNQIP